MGRERDLARLGDFVDHTEVQGGAFVLLGEAGVGKSVLLEVATARAQAAGHRVLHASGSQFEAEVSFAGLHQILHPLFADLPNLSPVHERALSVALGLGEGAPPGQLLVANAALTLLRQAAVPRPLLVVIDDIAWLDRASAVVLGFVARRLTGSRVALLAASRSGEESFFEHTGLPGYELQPLAEPDATALLKAHFPALAPRTHRRLLADAQGNPLALLELPVALDGVQRVSGSALPPVLPLSGRLQAVFASRIKDLPAATYDLLLLAVLDGTGDLNVLHASEPRTQETDVLGPAEQARLVRVEQGARRLVFRHPLIGSAVVELSTGEQRRRAHRLLAERLADRPERRAWHLAEAAVGADEGVAALLQAVAHANLRRGDSVRAITLLLRAAEMSPADIDRAGRLGEAAYLGAIVNGDLRDAPHLLELARRADRRGESLATAVAGAYQLLNGDGDVDSAHRLMVGAIEMLADPGDAHNKPLIEGLYTLLMVCYFGGRAELWEPFHAAIRRLRPGPPELLDILGKTFSDPARLAPPVLDRLDAAIAGLKQEVIPARISRIGIAGSYVDRLGQCREGLWRVIGHGRDGGAVTSAIEALFLLGNDAFLVGQWEEMEQVVDEGLTLCDKHGYRLLAWTGIYLRAMLAAARGQADTATVLADQMIRWATPRRARALQCYAWQIRALVALGRGDFEDAYHQSAAISPAGVLASHVPHALWSITDLVEAAVRTGRHAEAAAHAAAVGRAGLALISPRLAMVAGASAAMIAPDGQYSRLFEAALATTDAERWPFERARLQLTYGERLRRDKATAEARTQLAAAVDTFRSLDARPWTARASAELRATGLSIGQGKAAAGMASLTPQQQEIAVLAAAGLTNKQIGERLFLSPRTVANHLYQLFPKLGVASRAALSDALTTAPVDLPKGDGEEQASSR
ncbi:LuxR family transcriptional regulator [Planotetraspora thailandica]|uniref:LuxR family transcriptional regulator n=1 Tax=Planotetraspora thailandica TaxID=487172 RepID=A0A8J3Y1K8_9ACTN|nr:LuxR family transcriptional regulator [Planotetraspora thailandica]GII59180.1 LuxR family transcriptional regulator [Planotetraspora thailandica]